MKILSVEAEFFHADGETDRHDALCNFAKALTNSFIELKFFLP